MQPLFDSLIFMFGVVEVPDDNADIIHVHDSPATYRFFSLPTGSMLGKTATELGVTPEVIDAWIARYREAERENREVRFEYEHPTANGTLRLVSVVACLGRADNGRMRFSYLTQDVTEQRRSDQRLRDRELHLRLAMDASLVIAFEWDIRQNRVRRLQSIEAALPETESDTLEGVANVVHPDDRERFLGNVKQAAASADGLYRSEFRIVRPDGAVRWLFESGRVTFDAEHEPVRLIGISQDITERRRTEDELREADRRKDEFIAVLAHELRNPLAPVRTAVEILRRSAAPEPRVERARAVIERQVTHMARIIDDLLDVSRIARGRLELRREICDLATITRQTAEDYRASIEAAGLTLVVVDDGVPAWVDGDVVRLAQMTGNLLNNAGRFTPKGGRIEVRTAPDVDRRVAEVTVTDTGVGIDSVLLSRLFDPFAQAEQGLARTQGGLGLGLALTKGLAELHGGGVSASSAGPGKGSTFTVRVPLSAERYGHGATQRPQSAAPVGRKILIVEDNHDAADTLADLLQLSGHDVRVAYDGASGVVLARDFHPEAVVCDLGLPGQHDGFDVARALRADPSLRGVYLIALSGYADDETRRRSREEGFEAHFAKPPDIERLERALADLGRP